MVFQKHCVHKYAQRKLTSFQFLIHLLFESGARWKYTFKWWSVEYFFFKFEIVECNEELGLIAWRLEKDVVLVFLGENLVSCIYVRNIKLWDTVGYHKATSPFPYQKTRSHLKERRACMYTPVHICKMSVHLIYSSTGLTLGKEDTNGKL